jgi:hypothetical protein
VTRSCSDNPPHTPSLIFSVNANSAHRSRNGHPWHTF